MELGDHRQRCAPSRRGQRARVAMGQDPAHAGELLGPQGGDRLAGALLLLMQRDGGGQRGRRARPVRGHGRSGGRGDAANGVGEIGGGGTGLLERRAGLAQRAGIASERQRHPVAGRDADQRRPTDRQPPDRLGHLVGIGQLQLHFGLRQKGLIERVQHAAIEPQGDDGTGAAGGVDGGQLVGVIGG